MAEPAATLVVPYRDVATVTVGGRAVRETLDTGAFADYLADQANELAVLWQHDYSKPLGRRSMGHLEIDDGPDALSVRLLAWPETSWGTDARAAKDAGLLGGASPRLVVSGQYYADGVRHVSRSALPELSMVTIPAYSGSAVRTGARYLPHHLPGGLGLDDAPDGPQDAPRASLVAWWL